VDTFEYSVTTSKGDIAVTISTLLPQTPAHPTEPLMTAEEFMQRYGDQSNIELIKGVVKELPMPTLQHGTVCATLTRLLGNHVAGQKLGRVMCNDSFVKTRKDPDSVRGADVCYVSYERLPRGKVPPGLLDVVPEFVIEVRSPSNTWDYIFTKVGEYLGARVRVVIVVDEGTTSASVYRLEEFQQIFHNGDELTIPDVLPGFSFTVRSLFEE